MSDAKNDLLHKLDGLEARVDDGLPRVFGSYLLLASLARGGMGEVFLARHGGIAGLEKHCVVKTLRPHLTDDREYVARFIDEARVVVHLGHRNICQVFDVGAVGERFYLAMEHISGRDLRSVQVRLVEQGRGFDAGLVVHVIAETLEALDYAHRHEDTSGRPMRLVHRDVSPQNVMVSFEGETKLIDFGLAASTLKAEQTSPNVVMGKLAYMAPEQVRGERVDGRADLFACAIMLYELLVGERFYEGRASYEVGGLAAQGGYRPRQWHTLDDALRSILDRALAADAGHRHATCLQLREELLRWRYARGLHGDGVTLRGVMHEAFRDDIRQWREAVAGFATMASRVPAPSPTSAEPTQSFATSTGPSSAGAAPTTAASVAASIASPAAGAAETTRLARVAIEQRAVAGRDPTEPTTAIAARSKTPRRAAAALALLALLGGVAGTAVWRMRTGPPPVSGGVVAVTAPVVDVPLVAAGLGAAGLGDAGVGAAGVGAAGVGAAGVGDAGVGAAGVVAAGVGDAGVGDAGVGDAGVGAAAGALAGVDGTAAAVALRDPVAAPAATGRPVLPTKAPAAAMAPASPASPSSPSSAPPATGPSQGRAPATAPIAASTQPASMEAASTEAASVPWRSMTRKKRLEAIAARCPGLPCLAPLQAQVGRLGGLNAADIQALMNAIDACRDTCAPLR